MKHRYRPSRVETALSLLVMAALMAAAGAIFLRQSDVNPAVVAGMMAPANSQPPAPAGSAAAGSGWNGFLPTMTALTPPEVFGAANLSDKVNGKADLYLSAGFRELKSRRFKMTGDENSWLEIFVYDMGELPNAFSVFSQQRREDAVPLEFGAFSYRAQNTLVFLHGPFYVEIIGSDAAESLFSRMRTFARNFIQNTPVDADRLEELELFPKENLDPDSLALIAEGGFGYERFNRIFTAAYTDGDARMTAFLSRRSSPMEAQELAQGYHDFLMAYGGKVETASGPLKDLLIVDILGTYELFFVRGNFLAGVHEAADKDQAERLVLLLDKKLAGGTDAGR